MMPQGKPMALGTSRGQSRVTTCPLVLSLPHPTTCLRTHQATPTGFMGFLPFFRVGMYSTPSGSCPAGSGDLGGAGGPAGRWQLCRP